MRWWWLALALAGGCEIERDIGAVRDGELADASDAGTSDASDPADLGPVDAGPSDASDPIDAGSGEAGLGDGEPPPDLGPPDSGCWAGAKRVFVTATPTPGNLKSAGGGRDGLDGADRLCAQAAARGGLRGTFVAWLSSSSTAAIDRLPADGPWTLPDGCTLIAESRDALLRGGPAAPIDRTELDEPAEPYGAWTGTLPTGRADGFTCRDWEDGSFRREGTVGAPSGGLRFWTEVASNPCDRLNALYCFER